MIVFGLIDIDEFTSFNLSNSFEKGNIMLNELEGVATTILSPIEWRKLDADEFIFYLHGSFKDNKHNLSTLLLKCEHNLGITISIGLAESTKYLNFEQVINQLRVNLLTAKKYGKNKMCLT